jgi:peptidoglycan/LPS O-acetylase OafA/YrhL
METPTASTRVEQATKRLHYLDWLQVLAVLGVFLFHAVHPFDDLFPWHIKNTERSAIANFFVGFFAFSGMPFFFLMAGATSWFSLQRRTAGRYVRERVTRLFIPFILGSIVLTPIQAYFEFTHKGWWKAPSIIHFIFSPEARSAFYTEYVTITFSPKILAASYHLWFVGALFAFALVALPIFIWLNRDSGKRFLASIAQLATRRGGLLAFIIPLVLIRFVLQPIDSAWADFFYYLFFFVFGYMLIADERFLQAIRRDRVLHLILGMASTLSFIPKAVGVPVFEWLGSFGTPEFYGSWILYGINSWCWTLVIFYVGMRFLDSTSKWLQFGREASYPFFFLHQPVILFIAFYVVQWDVTLLIKVLVVVIGSFALTLGIYELLVRRINPVRALFGMKPGQKLPPAPTASP